MFSADKEIHQNTLDAEPAGYLPLRYDRRINSRRMLDGRRKEKSNSQAAAL